LKPQRQRYFQTQTVRAAGSAAYVKDQLAVPAARAEFIRWN
jgi:hypothetical protein